MPDVKPPAKNPCGSCPYRKDVPSGVWHESEYAKLPPYDGETISQPTGLFMCHQQDGRLCAGWVGCHDMDNNFALRFAAHRMDEETLVAILDYETEVPLWESGQAAAEHGMKDNEDPDWKARRTIGKLLDKGLAREQ